MGIPLTAFSLNARFICSNLHLLSWLNDMPVPGGFLVLTVAGFAKGATRSLAILERRRRQRENCGL
jgi:hypothetical protein